MQTTDTLTVMNCCECHVRFAIPQSMYDESVNDGSGWKCPNGHSLTATGLTTKEELKKARADAERREQRLLADLERKNASNLKLQHKLRAEKGAKTKLKKRIASGTCPCCNRNFKQLHRHIKSQHPEFNHATD